MFRYNDSTKECEITKLFLGTTDENMLDMDSEYPNCAMHLSWKNASIILTHWHVKLPASTSWSSGGTSVLHDNTPIRNSIGILLVMHELQGPQTQPIYILSVFVPGNILWSKQQRYNSQIVTRRGLAGYKALIPTSCTTDNNPYKGSISNMHTLTSSEAKKQKKIKLIRAFQRD